MAQINAPALWREHFPAPDKKDHKYARGHTLVVGSDQHTGATRLAAEACSRIGSGLVTVWNQHQADLYRIALPADIMIKDGEPSGLNGLNTVLAGPGGCSENQAETILEMGPAAKFVLDADAIRLHDRIPKGTGILTPHDGEFVRYFGSLGSDRERAAMEVATKTACIVILKGHRTLICAPDQRVIANETASPYLAKAGTGDVLAGLVAGLVAQGMPRFEAAAAGVWIHGRASERIGPGLVPQDLFPELRAVLLEILS